MNNYIPSEFTLAEFEKLLRLASNHFKFKKYTDPRSNENSILWRHDIDFSLEQAVKLAKIESNHQIQSTYFIHLHSEFYNALDLGSLALIKEIVSYGHALGLHFDIAYYNLQSLKQLNYWLLFEKNILESLFEQEISVFSFHNTSEYSMSFEDEIYAGMINTYSHYFKNQVHYCSDSNGHWRYRKLLDVLSDPSITQLQVLTHPEWWTTEAQMPREKIIQYIDSRRAITLFNYDKALEIAGRINIG